MQFSESLKKNEQFRFVYKNGRSYANKYFIMYVKENGLDIPVKHIANSAGIMQMDNEGFDMVRAGIVIYGL